MRRSRSGNDGRISQSLDLENYDKQAGLDLASFQWRRAPGLGSPSFDSYLMTLDFKVPTNIVPTPLVSTQRFLNSHFSNNRFLTNIVSTSIVSQVRNHYSLLIFRVSPLLSMDRRVQLLNVVTLLIKVVRLIVTKWVRPYHLSSFSPSSPYCWLI